jgi:outer membrane protein TolC
MKVQFDGFPRLARMTHVAAALAAVVLADGAVLAGAENPRIRAAQALELTARAHRGQARAARSPSVTAVIGTGPSLRAKLVPGSGVVSTENIYGDVGLDDLSVVVGGQLDVIQPLYTFGKIAERERAAEHELVARQAETALTRADIMLRVAEIYEAYLYARDGERFFDEMEHFLSRSIEDAKAELASGTGATEQDILRLEAGRSALRVGAHQASAARRQAEAGLLAYLALPTGTLPPLVEVNLEPIAIDLPEPKALVALALEHRPELVATREAAAAHLALSRAEAAGNYPDVFALLLASAAYTPGRDVVDSRYVQDPLNGFYPGVFVGARWQLTLGMPDERAAEQRAVAQQYSELERFARSGVPAEVRVAFEEVQRAQADVEEAPTVGLGHTRELTDAARAYVELRVTSFDAVYRHNVGLARLARATGTLGAAGSFYPGKEQ